MVDYVLHGLQQVPLKKALRDNCHETLVLIGPALLSFDDPEVAQCSNPDCPIHAYMH